MELADDIEHGAVLVDADAQIPPIPWLTVRNQPAGNSLRPERPEIVPVESEDGGAACPFVVLQEGLVLPAGHRRRDGAIRRLSLSGLGRRRLRGVAYWAITRWL
jgi:hypothetical protein